MLQNGTVISGTLIERPHSFRSACTITTQIITQVASSQYGGSTINLAHLAPFVEESRKRYKKKFNFLTDEGIELLLEDEIRDGVQTIQYQLITMSTTNGQAPFVSIFMYLKDTQNKQEEKDLAKIIKQILLQRIEGVKNEQGVPITTAFPKLLYVLDENNISEDSEYWYLTKLAAECSAKRLVPDYISAKKMKELKGDVYGCMGCRSFLAGDPVDHHYWGKFNQGVCSINLAATALEAINTNRDFWEVLDERLDLCYRALMIRHNRLLGTKSDVAPILWQHGAIARLKPGEAIDKFLFGNNSSISLGYAGLWETVLALTGKTLLDQEGKELGLRIMKYLNQKCEEWKEKENVGFSLYGTPMENTTTKFAKALKEYPTIEGVNDKLYITNSYHITPSQNIDAFNKLTTESEFQELSLGGAISYVETPNMINNIEALLEVIKHIYNTIMYAEINTMTSYCQICGCTDIHMEDDLKFHCPSCGNDDFDKMNIALRVCGYISTNPFSLGRAADIYSRVYHLDSEECDYVESSED
jgi:ribonucleoside-triphosphate reductase